MRKLMQRDRYLPIALFALWLAIGLAGLIRAQKYYGSIYRGWDAQFYYSLSHSLVFDADLDITNNIRDTPFPQPFDQAGDGTWADAPRGSDGRIPSKYPIGLSLIEVPFLAIGAVLRSLLTDVGVEFTAKRGYSALELWSVAVGMMALFTASMVLLFRQLAPAFGRMPAAVAVSSAWLGTSLFYYASIFPFMAHAMSYAALVGVLAATKTWQERGANWRHAVMIGLAIGAAFLIRPQQVAVIVPTLAVLAWQGSVRKDYRPTPYSLLICAVVAAFVLLHLVWVRSQFGQWAVSGYAVGKEGFNWTSPDFGTVLVSHARGLFVHSPIAVLGILGWVLAAKRLSAYQVPSVLNAIMQVYIVSAWSSPEQGHSFGARMLSDNSEAMAVGIGLLLTMARGVNRWILVAAIVLCVAWTCWKLAMYVLTGP